MMSLRSVMPSRRRVGGFSLIELLVVVAIIALLISILLPSLARAREMARRGACAANLRSVVTASLIYSGSSRQGVLPTPSYNYNENRGQYGTLVGGARELDDAELINRKLSVGNTRGWFKLLIGGERAYLQSKQFICPSTKHLKHNLDGGQASAFLSTGEERPVYDFHGWDDRLIGDTGSPSPDYVSLEGSEMRDFSYSFQMTLKYVDRNDQEWGAKLTSTRDPRLAIGADRNPYSNAIDGRMPFGNDVTKAGMYYFKADTHPSGGYTAPPEQQGSNDGSDTEPEDYFTAALARRHPSVNSRNHQRQGQNVVYLDTHVKWSSDPLAGADNDCIWSRLLASNSNPKLPESEDWDQHDGILDAVHEVPSSSMVIFAGLKSRPNWTTDSLLVP